MKTIIIILLSIWGYYFTVYMIAYLYAAKTLPKPEKDSRNREKKRLLIIKLIYDLPVRMALDARTRNRNAWNQYGLHMICGEQGSGKTLTMAYLLLKYKHQFPRLKIATNFDYKFQDRPLMDWKDLTLDTNGIYGEIDCIDEIQTWFSSNQSRDFPPDFLTIITQQRKVRRSILATSQVFTRIAKPLREQTYLMYLPFTIFGCLTVVRVYKPLITQDGDLKEKKLRKVFCFVHTKEVRDAFDTFKTVESYTKSGFKPSSEQYQDSQIKLVQEPEKRKKIIG